MILQRVIHMVPIKIGNLIRLDGWNGDIFFGVVLNKDRDEITIMFHDGDIQWYLQDELEDERMYILEVS